MKCPKCGAKTRVVETRSEDIYNETYRKHKCENCGHVFYTREFEVAFNNMFQKFWNDNNRTRVRQFRGRKKSKIEEEY